MNHEMNPSSPQWEPGQTDRRSTPRIYTRASFQALLERMPEWKVREVLEQQNIPSCHKKDARDWLAARLKARRAARTQH